MRRLALILAVLLICFAVTAEGRIVSVDFYILLDVSLSMEGQAIRDAREYTAQNIIGALVEPDDWVCLIKFWGDREVVWQDYIRSEADKAQLIRGLATVEADGRFTDIGSALDLVASILDRRGDTERPKYILLITDEIQEAPYGSRYYAADNILRHHMLDYVHRIDRGLYRVITVGYPLRDSIEDSARYLYDILSNPPERPRAFLPGAPAEVREAAVGQADSQDGREESEPVEGRLPGSRTAGGLTGTLLLAALIIAAIIIVVLILLRIRRQTGRAKPKKEDEGEL